MADPTTHAALTVVSARPPSDIYRTSRVGQVKEDASYIAEDLPYISDDIRDLGITLDRDRYIDTRSVSGDPATHPPGGSAARAGHAGDVRRRHRRDVDLDLRDG